MVIQQIVDKQCWYFTAYLNEILKLVRFFILPELEESQTVIWKFDLQPSPYGVQLFILYTIPFIGFLQFDVFRNINGKNRLSLESKLTKIIAKDTKYLLEFYAVIKHSSVRGWLKFKSLEFHFNMAMHSFLVQFFLNRWQVTAPCD